MSVSHKRYANEQLLVGTDWLAAHLDDPQLRLVEVTPPGSGYVLAHLPGAVHLDLGQVFTGRGSAFPHGIGPANEVAAVLGQLGLTPAQHIIIHDEIGGQRAAKTLWLLEYLGFPQVSVLEGGIERWLAEGRKVTRVLPTVQQDSFAPAIQPERQATSNWIVSHLHDEAVILIDCRTGDEFAEGHIPGARLRPWDQTLTRRAHQAFREAEELQAEFAALGVTEDKEAVVYCGTGLGAAHSYLALRLLGYSRVRNYDGSWTEWNAREDLPKA